MEKTLILAIGLVAMVLIVLALVVVIIIALPTMIEAIADTKEELRKLKNKKGKVE